MSPLTRLSTSKNHKQTPLFGLSLISVCSCRLLTVWSDDPARQPPNTARPNIHQTRYQTTTKHDIIPPPNATPNRHQMGAKRARRPAVLCTHTGWIKRAAPLRHPVPLGPVYMHGSNRCDQTDSWSGRETMVELDTSTLANYDTSSTVDTKIAGIVDSAPSS